MTRSTKSVLLLLGLLLIGFPATAQDCGETAMSDLKAEMDIARARLSVATTRGEYCKTFKYLNVLTYKYNEALGDNIKCFCKLNRCPEQNQLRMIGGFGRIVDNSMEQFSLYEKTCMQ